MNKYLSLFSFIFIPFLFLWNPSWFSLMGAQPNWPIFWLLPWAIINGSVKTMLVGLFLGLILDSINNDFYTQIPGLMIAGFWFGRLENINKFKFTKFQYGAIASIGSFICGSIYFIQILLDGLFEKKISWLFSYGINNIFSQVLLTGLLAPVFCSWLYLIFSRKDQLKF